jgi:hypothetical protein
MNGSPVVAKKRKRCPGCNKIIEVGSTAILTDDRYTTEAHTFFVPGVKQYRAGAFHLWHTPCRDEYNAATERLRLQGAR